MRNLVQYLCFLLLTLQITFWIVFTKFSLTTGNSKGKEGLKHALDKMMSAKIISKIAPPHEQSIIMVHHFLAGAGGYIALSYNVFGHIIEHPHSDAVTFPIYDIFDEPDKYQPWMRVYLLRTTTVNTKPQTWEQHMHGFELKNQYFIGLELLHFIVALQRTKLLALFRAEDDGDYLRYAVYDDFVLGNAAEKYRIKNLGKFRGNTENWLSKYWVTEYVAFNVSDPEEQQRYEDRCPMLALRGWWGGANKFCKLPLSFRGSLELYIRPFDREFKLMEV